jgi:O-antigen ligase
MWFGFCAVYFLFWGFQSQTLVLRAASWVVAVGCFYVVTLTVSRAPLLGIILACAVGFRAELKRSFVPVLSLGLLLCFVYVFGIFDEELGQYLSRATEESGRGRLWPAAVERILDSPWIGVGLDDIKIRMGAGRFVNPHNPILHIALGVGLIPVMCFLGYLAQVAIGTRWVIQRVQVGEASLLPPLAIFGLFEIMTLDMAFMTPWVVVIFGLAARTFEIQGYRKEW